MFHQIVSLVGASLVLAAYGANQLGWTGPHDRRYSVANFFGAGLLLWIAVVDWRMGFILLEGAWVLISIRGLWSPPPARAEEARP